MDILIASRRKSRQGLRMPSHSRRSVCSRATAGSQLRLGPGTMTFAKNKSQKLKCDDAATWCEGLAAPSEAQSNTARRRAQTLTPTWTCTTTNKKLHSTTLCGKEDCGLYMEKIKHAKQQREKDIMECVQLKKQIFDIEKELRPYKEYDKLAEWVDLKLEECSTVISSFQVLMLEHKARIFQHPLTEKDMAILSFLTKWKGAIADFPTEPCDNSIELLNKVGSRLSVADSQCEISSKRPHPREELDSAMIVEDEIHLIEKELAQLDLLKAETEDEIKELKPALEEARRRLRETPEFVCEQRNHVLTEEKCRLPAVQLRFVASKRPEKKWRRILEDLVIEYANLPHAVVRCSAKNGEIVCELEVLEEHEAFEGAHTLQALVFENTLTPAVLENHVKFVGVGNLQVFIITPTGRVLYDRRGHAKRRPTSDNLSTSASPWTDHHYSTTSSSSASPASSSRSSSVSGRNTDELDGETTGRNQAAQCGAVEEDDENGPFAMHPAYRAMLMSDDSNVSAARRRSSASVNEPQRRGKLTDENENSLAQTTPRAAGNEEIVHVHVLWDHVAAAWGGPPIKAWFHLLVHRVASLSTVLRVAQKYLSENDKESNMIMSMWKNVVNNANDDKGPQVDFMDVYPKAANLLQTFCKRFLRRSGSLHGIEHHLITINSFFFTKKTFRKLCDDMDIAGARDVFGLLDPGNGRLFVEDFAFLVEFCEETTRT